MFCNYYIACGCRNYSPPPGFLQPFLCHVLQAILYLMLGLIYPCFPLVFLGFSTFNGWCCLRCLTLGTTHKMVQVFFFNQTLFFMRGHFNYKEITLRRLNVLPFSYACGLDPCSSRVLLGRQMNRLCSWMELVLIPLATCPLKHLAPTLQQSPGGQRPALMAVLWRQKPCH